MFKPFTLLCGSLTCIRMLSPAPASTTGTEEQAVEAAIETLRKLMITPDPKQLETLTSTELSYGHSNGRVQTQGEFIDDLKTGASDFIHIQLLDQTVKVVDNSAIVRHTLDADTNDAGKPGHVTIKILQVWHKQNGRWILLARQAVRPAS